MSRAVIVTGASHGIGRAAAVLFARKGYCTVINYHRSESEALSLAHSLTLEGCSVLAVQADVSDPVQVKELFQRTEAAFGGLEILVNNAGISQTGLFTDCTPRQWDRVFGVNVKGAFLCSQQAASLFLREHRGKIVNVSSIWGITGASCEAVYSASKAALIGLTKSLAKELGPSGIQVNCVAPGVVDTKMNAGLTPEELQALRDETPLGVIGTSEDIAQAIWFLASPESDFITGQVLSPNGGFLI